MIFLNRVAGELAFSVSDVREMLREGREPFPFICEQVGKLKVGEGVIIVAPLLRRH